MEQRIDPSLIAQDRVLYAGSNYGEPVPQQELYIHRSSNIDQHQWANLAFEHDHDPLLYNDLELNREGSQIHDPQMHVLKGSEEGWQLEGSLDDCTQFQNWLPDEE
jgi:hypothetical protein